MIVNYLQNPPPQIFINYEKLLRQKLAIFFESYNKKLEDDGYTNVRVEVASNDIVWIEIHIPAHL